MKRSSMVSTLILGILYSASTLGLEQYKKEYQIIDSEKASKMIYEIPSQHYLWNSSKLHLGILSISLGKAIDDWEFDIPGKLPLSVYFNINEGELGTIFNFPILSSIKKNLPADKKGNFRVGPLPSQLEDHINQTLLSDTEWRAMRLSRKRLGEKELADVVKKNIENGLPTLTFYVIDADKQQVVIYSIVGIKKEENGSNTFLVIDTMEQGEKRLKKFNAGQFVTAMDASKVIKYVKNVEWWASTLGIRSLVERDNGMIVPSDVVEKWLPYSLITFVPAKDYEKEKKIEAEIAAKNDEEKDDGCLIN